MKSEDLYHVEDGYNGYPSCCEDADYAYEEEEDSYGCGNRVQESWNRNGTNEAGFCEGIFSYFPCNQNAYELHMTNNPGNHSQSI